MSKKNDSIENILIPSNISKERVREVIFTYLEQGGDPNICVRHCKDYVSDNTYDNKNHTYLPLIWAVLGRYGNCNNLPNRENEDNILTIEIAQDLLKKIKKHGGLWFDDKTLEICKKGFESKFSEDKINHLEDFYNSLKQGVLYDYDASKNLDPSWNDDKYGLDIIPMPSLYEIGKKIDGESYHLSLGFALIEDIDIMKDYLDELKKACNKIHPAMYLTNMASLIRGQVRLNSPKNKKLDDEPYFLFFKEVEKIGEKNLDNVFNFRLGLYESTQIAGECATRGYSQFIEYIIDKGYKFENFKTLYDIAKSHFHYYKSRTTPEYEDMRHDHYLNTAKCFGLAFKSFYDYKIDQSTDWNYSDFSSLSYILKDAEENCNDIIINAILDNDIDLEKLHITNEDISYFENTNILREMRKYPFIKSTIDKHNINKELLDITNNKNKRTKKAM